MNAVKWLYVEFINESMHNRSVVSVKDVFNETTTVDGLVSFEPGTEIKVKWQGQKKREIEYHDALVLLVGPERPPLVSQLTTDLSFRDLKRGEIKSVGRSKRPRQSVTEPASENKKESTPKESSTRSKNDINAAERQIKIARREKESVINDNLIAAMIEEAKDDEKVETDSIEELLLCHKKASAITEDMYLQLKTKLKETEDQLSEVTAAKQRLEEEVSQLNEKNTELLQQIECLSEDKDAATSMTQDLQIEIDSLNQKLEPKTSSLSIVPLCIKCEKLPLQVKSIIKKIEVMRRELENLPKSDSAGIELIVPVSANDSLADSSMDDFGIIDLETPDLPDPDIISSTPKCPKTGPLRTVDFSNMQSMHSPPSSNAVKRVSKAFRSKTPIYTFTLEEFSAEVKKYQSEHDAQLKYPRNQKGNPELQVLNCSPSGFLVETAVINRITRLPSKQLSDSVKLREVILSMLDPYAVHFITLGGETRGSNKIQLAPLHPDLKKEVAEFLKLDVGKSSNLLSKYLASTRENILISDLN